MKSPAKDPASQEHVAAQARVVAPVIWLLGKVQSGKSSIVRALTGSTKAEIGSGFRACTLSADVYELPPEAPVIRFLDTRGLGEASYDPADDLAISQASSHCTIAVMRTMDPQQDSVIDTLASIRRRDPHWPVVVAQTHLHEGYAAGDNHPELYPYDADGGPQETLSSSVPDDLRRSLAYQRERFRSLPGDGAIAFVPVDFTQQGDGFEPTLFGLDALQEQLTRIGPAALKAALSDAAKETGNPVAAGLHRIIVGHAAAASAADLIPVAAVAAVPVVQGRWLQIIGEHYNTPWTARTAAEFASALGAGFVARYAAAFGIRQLTKLIPVYGQTAGAVAAAAVSFATTYAVGKTAIYFLELRRHGQTDNAAVQKVWAQSLREAFDLAQVRGLTRTDQKGPS